MVPATCSLTMVAPATPSIVTDLHSFHLYGWVLASYVLASAIAVPVVGKLSDVYGRRPFYLWGLVLFIAGSLLSGFAGSIASLLTGRFIAGAGGGALMVLGQTALADIFGARERGRWLAVFSAANGAAGTSGPFIGGVITQYLGWRWVFFSVVPVSAIAFVAVGMIMPRLRRSGVRNPVDVRGAALTAGALVALLLGLTWGGTTYPWGSWQVVSLLTAVPVLVAALIVTEREAAAPLIDPALFGDRGFTISIGVTFVTFGVVAATGQLVPLFVQGEAGASAQSAGIVMMPAAFGSLLGAVTAGQIISLTGKYKLTGLVGALALVASPFLLSRLSSGADYRNVMIAVLFLGIAQGATGTTTWVVANAAFSHRVLGAVNSTRTLFMNLGQAIFVPVMSLIVVAIAGRQLSLRIPPAAQAVLARRHEAPTELITPESQLGIRTDFTHLSNGMTLYSSFVRGLHDSFGYSLTHVFALLAAISVVAWVMLLFLPVLDLERNDLPRPVDVLEPVAEMEV
jgi:MFS family permease